MKDDQAIVTEAPMPLFTPRAPRLTRNDKESIDRMEIGDGLKFFDFKSARCALARMSQKGWNAASRRDDGFITVWRAK